MPIYILNLPPLFKVEKQRKRCQELVGHRWISNVTLATHLSREKVWEINTKTYTSNKVKENIFLFPHSACRQMPEEIGLNQPQERPLL